MARSRRPRRTSAPDSLPPVPSADRPAGGTVRVALAIGLVGLVIAVFANGLFTPFQYDDLSVVVDNLQIRDLRALGTVLDPPANSSPAAGRPILNLSYALNYAAGGTGVTGYHAANIALHTICVLILFVVVRRTARLPSVGFGDAEAATFAGAVAAIWALHPLHTGTVTYVSGRSESLMAVWFLLSVLAAVRAWESPQERWWTIIAVSSCAIGMATKESMATAPIAIALYDRAFLFDSFAGAMARRWRLYLALAGTWLVLVFLLWSAPHSESIGFNVGMTPWTYLLNQAQIVPEYFRLALWPANLAFAYGEPRALHLSDVWLGAGIAVLLIAASVWLWRWRPQVGVNALLVFLILAPTSSIIPITTEVAATRRMYLPLIGLAVLFVLAVRHVAGRLAPPDQARRRRLIVAGIVFVAGAALAAVTLRENALYASDEALWRVSLERWPSALAHRNLATALSVRGNHQEAIEHLRQAMVEHPEVGYALGAELAITGRLTEAISELTRALRLPGEPAAVPIRYELARALAKNGASREAARIYQEILDRAPNEVNARLGRADALLAAGDFDAAAAGYRDVLRAHPDHTGASMNLGLSLLQSGHALEAIPLLRSTVTRHPDDARARLNLAVALFSTGDAGAIDAAAQAVRLAPNDPRARDLFERVQASLSKGERKR